MNYSRVLGILGASAETYPYLFLRSEELNNQGTNVGASAETHTQPLPPKGRAKKSGHGCRSVGILADRYRALINGDR